MNAPSPSDSRLGETMTQRNFMTWMGACVVCGKIRRAGHGLFCSNYLLGRGPYPPCRNVWCGECFQEAADDPFPRLQGNEEEEGSDLVLGKVDQERYRHARNGDHLMGIPFECDLCHFRNVCGRNPIWKSGRDEFTLTAIRRVSLDALWARETSTVKANWSRARADYLAVRNTLSIRDFMPVLGYEKVEDRVGMAPALMTIITSLRAGVNAENVQWDTMRKTTTWYGNAYNAGRNYNNDAVLGGDKSKQNLTDCPTHGEFNTRARKGARLRMGMVRRQNEALTSELVLAMHRVAEEEWQGARSQATRENLEEVMAFMLIGFGSGLRGEEVPLTSLEGLLTFWNDTAEAEDPHMMMTLYGRFKGELDQRWHCVPISDKSRSNIPFRLWIERLLHRRMNLQQRTNGWLFCKKDGTRQKFAAYDEDFRQLIVRAREKYPRALPAAVDVNDFSLWRSLRRGAVLETINQDVSEKVIELINRWKAARGSLPGLPMRQVYTQVRSTVPTMLLYSKAL